MMIQLSWTIVYEASSVGEPTIYRRRKANNKRKQPSSSSIIIESSQASKKEEVQLWPQPKGRAKRQFKLGLIMNWNLIALTSRVYINS